jgi:LmbE family N-acetylglucosaminyl deacetylase
MLKLLPQFPTDRPLRLLCIGAHSDDLEIGCGGTVATWLETWASVEVTWVVLTAVGDREDEARRSARALLRRAATVRLELGRFNDGFLPAQYADVKQHFEWLKQQVNPDVVLTHCLGDRHQDHKLAAELTWNTWRDHLIYEYEIPKYEGDLAQPNVYVPLTARAAQRKTAHLAKYFSSQRSRAWFRAENFEALMRLRGLECRAPSGLAEAFHGRKLVF